MFATGLPSTDYVNLGINNNAAFQEAETKQYRQWAWCERNPFINSTFFTPSRPIPEKEFVEAYVKAYYLTEPDMERWIREHKVNFNLLLCICQCHVP